MTKIFKARLDANLTQDQVARPLNRSGMWLSLVERDKLRVAPEVEQQILIVIKRLSDYRAAARVEREKLVADLRLPRRGTAHGRELFI